MVLIIFNEYDGKNGPLSYRFFLLFQVKDSLRDDPRYKCVKHEDREVLFNEYISELKAIEEKAERKDKVKKEEEVYILSLALSLSLSIFSSKIRPAF